MEIKKFDWKVLFYPNLINPLDWLLMIYFFPKLIIGDKTKEITLKAYVMFVVFMFMNTFWYNIELSVSYADYLDAKWFSKHSKMSVKRASSIQSAFEKYMEIKTKRKNRK